MDRHIRFPGLPTHPALLWEGRLKFLSEKGRCGTKNRVARYGLLQNDTRWIEIPYDNIFYDKDLGATSCQTGIGGNGAQRRPPNPCDCTVTAFTFCS